MPTVATCVAVLFVLIGGPVRGPAEAALLDRPPLRSLADTSPLIVTAVVEAAAARDATGGERLRLRVEDHVRGDAPRSVLNVRPPERGVSIPPGTRVLAFLAGAETARALLPLDGRALAVHVHRLEQWFEIRRLRAGTARDEALAGWLVGLVQDPATRTDGLHDLRALVGGRGPHRLRLPPSQRAELTELLLAWRGLAPEGLVLARVLGRHADPRIDRWLWVQLNEHDGGEAEPAARAMALLAERLDDDEARALARAQAEREADEPAEAARARTTRFLLRTEAAAFPAPGERRG